MKTLSILSRYRLLVNILALVLMLGVLVTSPPSTNAAICQDGCWAWNEKQGCTDNVTCCTWNDGTYSCWHW
jgi:hypothetical protein